MSYDVSNAWDNAGYRKFNKFDRDTNSYLLQKVTRKILVLTGKRGGYGAMKPMLRLLRDSPDFELQLVATDQHVNPRFGYTLQEIKKEFNVAATVDIEQLDASSKNRSKALGSCLTRMTDVFVDLAPDLCILYGDRGEVLVSAVAALHLNLPIAHIQGGDVSGSLDDSMRHALTKLAHLHFPATEESAKRIRRMGEEAWRIQVVGDNHIDLIVAGEYTPGPEVIAALGLNPQQPIVVVLQHPETTRPATAYCQAVETLEAVRQSGLQAVVIHPCSDAGHDGTIAAIEQLATPPQFQVHINLDAPIFWGLLSVSSVMVGNSSAGLIETPTFGLPSVNIGRRQIGRLHSENVLHVDHDRIAIAAAIDQALSASFVNTAKSCQKLFGDGMAGEKIVEALRRVSINDTLIQKTITY